MQIVHKDDKFYQGVIKSERVVLSISIIIKLDVQLISKR